MLLEAEQSYISYQDAAVSTITPSGGPIEWGEACRLNSFWPSLIPFFSVDGTESLTV